MDNALEEPLDPLLIACDVAQYRLHLSQRHEEKRRLQDDTARGPIERIAYEHVGEHSYSYQERRPGEQLVKRLGEELGRPCLSFAPCSTVAHDQVHDDQQYDAEDRFDLDQVAHVAQEASEHIPQHGQQERPLL